MASSRARNSAVHRMRVKQRGSRVKPEVATVSLARGVFGGEGSAPAFDCSRAAAREQSNAGEFPKTLTPCARVHRYHACTWTRTHICNSLDLLLNSFSLRPFMLQNSNPYTHFFLSFLAVQRSTVWIFIFYARIFLIYIKIWHLLSL
jgi:hypothetical protein